MVYDHVAGRLSELDRGVVEAVPPGGNWRDLPSDFRSNRVSQIRESAARGEGSRSTYYGRLRADRPSYTISTYFNRPGNGCFIHPSAQRLITIREAARLQSFPDSYRFRGLGRARFVQVGNAVPPLMAYQIANVMPPGPVVDLFSGAGGLSLGFEWAGFQVLGSVDSDASSCEAYRANRADGDVVIEADLSQPVVHHHTMEEFQRRAGSDGVAIVIGGPPCQGFSTAGDCRPDDARNQLVFAFVHAIEVLRPRCLLMENVAALMQRRGSSTLRLVRQALFALGYETSLMIGHAEGYGVPQLRRRLFLMGALDRRDLRWPQPWRQLMAPAFTDSQPGAHLIPSSSLEPVTVDEAVDDLPTEPSESADQAVGYARAASSDYQRWCRGDLPLRSFVPDHGPVEIDDGCLPLPVSA